MSCLNKGCRRDFTVFVDFLKNFLDSGPIKEMEQVYFDFKYLEFQIISTLAFSSLQEKYVPPDQIFSVLVFRNHPE